VQLTYHTEEERLDILDIILRLFPENGVLIAVKNRKMQRKLLKQLKKVANRPVFGKSDEAWHTRPVTLVGTLHDARQVAHTGDFQVVVLADAQTATAMASDANPTPLWLLPDMRIFALVSPDSRLDTQQSLELEERLGPVKRGSGCRDCLPEVVVHTVGPFAYPAPDNSLAPLGRKRENIWHNAARNAAIARVATECLAGNHPSVSEYERQEETEDSTEGQETVPPTVVVLVESPEHARQLRKLLPDWPILGGRDGEGAVGAEDAEMPLMPDRAIVTWSRAYRDGLAVDVIIRADGTAARHREGFGPHVWVNRRSMVIVDFVDDFDEQARQDKIRRYRDYAERGFTILDADSV
jgi:hypothetical protein